MTVAELTTYSIEKFASRRNLQPMVIEIFEQPSSHNFIELAAKNRAQRGEKQ